MDVLGDHGGVLADIDDLQLRDDIFRDEEANRRARGGEVRNYREFHGIDDMEAIDFGVDAFIAAGGPRPMQRRPRGPDFLRRSNEARYRRRPGDHARRRESDEERGRREAAETLERIKEEEDARRKRKFQGNAMRNFASLLENSHTYPDCKIISKEGIEHKAHRCVLMARSAVFCSMFNAGMSESKSGVIKIDDLSSEAVRFLLNFIYTCDLLPFEVTTEETTETNKLCVSECIHAATKYQIDDLIQYFNETMGSLCNEENAQTLLRLANRFMLNKAQEEILKFICTRPSVLHPILKSI